MISNTPYTAAIWLAFVFASVSFVTCLQAKLQVSQVSTGLDRKEARRTQVANSLAFVTLLAYVGSAFLFTNSTSSLNALSDILDGQAPPTRTTVSDIESLLSFQRASFSLLACALWLAKFQNLWAYRNLGDSNQDLRKAWTAFCAVLVGTFVICFSLQPVKFSACQQGQRQSVATCTTDALAIEPQPLSIYVALVLDVTTDLILVLYSTFILISVDRPRVARARGILFALAGRLTIVFALLRLVVRSESVLIRVFLLIFSLLIECCVSVLCNNVPRSCLALRTARGALGGLPRVTWGPFGHRRGQQSQ